MERLDYARRLMIGFVRLVVVPKEEWRRGLD